MPPRYAYWTIIIDDAPTAFRAREREELVPTFRQLASRNPTATIKWFARGRLWDSPEQARAAAAPPREPRGKDWRPGGRHEDPRARFDKKKSENRRREHPGAKAPAYNPQPDGTSRSRPAQAPSGERPHGPNRERDRERAAHREHAANREFVGRGFSPANRGRDRSPREGSNRPPQAPKWDASRHQGPRRRGKWDSQPTERPRGPGADKRGFRPPDSRTENRGPHGKGPQDRGPHGKGPHGKGPQDRGPHGKGPHGKGPQGKGPQGKGPQGGKPWSGAPAKGGQRDRKWGDKRRGQPPGGDKKRWPRGAGPGTGAPTEPEPPAPTPPEPPGPDRPPRPGQEPRPDKPGGETIRILPDPPERAKE